MDKQCFFILKFIRASSLGADHPDTLISLVGYSTSSHTYIKRKTKSCYRNSAASRRSEFFFDLPSTNFLFVVWLLLPVVTTQRYKYVGSNIYGFFTVSVAVQGITIVPIPHPLIH
jgi:hypothetical protein